MSAVKSNESRAYMLEEWIEGGGVMIMGYEMYRNLSTSRNIRKKKLKESMTKTLVNPGKTNSSLILPDYLFKYWTSDVVFVYS